MLAFDSFVSSLNKADEMGRVDAAFCGMEDTDHVEEYDDGAWHSTSYDMKRDRRPVFSWTTLASTSSASEVCQLWRRPESGRRQHKQRNPKVAVRSLALEAARAWEKNSRPVQTAP